MQDKVVLITGAARGQGEAEARLMAAQGATVVVADVLDEAGEAVAGSLGAPAEYAHLDVTDLAQWEAVVGDIVARHGRLDVLVNNAGIFRRGKLVDASLDDWRLVMDVNCNGVFYGLRTAANAMIPQGSGSIVNISSVAGLQGAGGAFAYGASKWAVRGMTRTAAQELARHGIRVNSVHPGLIGTEMLDQVGDQNRMVKGVPMRRVATSEEVAQLVVFLASDESSYITGTEHRIDGGMMA